MNIKEWAKTSWASLTIAALMLQPFPTLAENPKSDGAAEQKKIVEIAPRSSAEVARFTRDLASEPSLTQAQKLALVRRAFSQIGGPFHLSGGPGGDFHPVYRQPDRRGHQGFLAVLGRMECGRGPGHLQNPFRELVNRRLVSSKLRSQSTNMDPQTFQAVVAKVAA